MGLLTVNGREYCTLCCSTVHKPETTTTTVIGKHDQKRQLVVLTPRCVEGECHRGTENCMIGSGLNLVSRLPDSLVAASWSRRLPFYHFWMASLFLLFSRSSSFCPSSAANMPSFTKLIGTTKRRRGREEKERKWGLSLVRPSMNGTEGALAHEGTGTLKLRR